VGKRHVFLTICFSPDDDPERKLELVLSEQIASRLGQALTSGSVGLMQEFNLSDANGIHPRRAGEVSELQTRGIRKDSCGAANALTLALDLTIQTLTKDELNMDSPHISIDRAVAFLLHGGELDPSEEEHLFKCDECRRLVVEAAATELTSPPNDSIGKKSDA
jgi:hypothetical protein